MDVKKKFGTGKKFSHVEKNILLVGKKIGYGIKVQLYLIQWFDMKKYLWRKKIFFDMKKILDLENNFHMKKKKLHLGKKFGYEIKVQLPDSMLRLEINIYIYIYFWT